MTPVCYPVVRDSALLGPLAKHILGADAFLGPEGLTDVVAGMTETGSPFLDKVGDRR